MVNYLRRIAVRTVVGGGLVLALASGGPVGYTPLHSVSKPATVGSVAASIASGKSLAVVARNSSEPAQEMGAEAAQELADQQAELAAEQAALAAAVAAAQAAEAAEAAEPADTEDVDVEVDEDVEATDDNEAPPPAKPTTGVDTHEHHGDSASKD